MFTVRDHSHWTGLFEGPAHRLCNLEYYDHFSVPLFFHNGTNYVSIFNIIVSHLHF